ncbi:MAG: dehydrogenase/acetyl-CoA synthase complex, epsilon subunit [Methanomicrobia archaeon]|nr:dehydrogenase/acetyl-CoA synthase complex, epsilon subunit [Methanomicrobia archaeon]
MDRKGISLKIGEFASDVGQIRDLELTVGRITRDTWAETMGPTPFPGMTALRSWDRLLLSRYRPFYLPFCDLCCLCTYGKCDLTGGKHGACGIDMAAQQSRIVLLASCIGAATHISHARELVTYCISRSGTRHRIDVGGVNVEVEAPITRLVSGVRPETLGDLERVLEYLEGQVTALLSATHTGMEGDALDFESKVLHAGMIDQVGMEVADIAQVSALGYPKADADAPAVPLGMGTVDTRKPVILIIGHNVPPAVGIIDNLHDRGLSRDVEVTGICCSAQDIARYAPGTKVIGPISWQLRYVRSGIADVIVLDEQCVRTDLLEEARQVRSPLIVTSEKNCLGLPDRTDDAVDQIAADLAAGRIPGALILDPEKAGAAAVETALRVAPERKKQGVLPDLQALTGNAEDCRGCILCRRSCPNDLPIPDAMEQAAAGNLEPLGDLYDSCVGCGRCEEVCPQEIPIHSCIVASRSDRLATETFTMRAGRGAIQDVEIRKVGGPIVLGEIPGVVAFVGCANYPRGGNDVAEMAVEFAWRKYIVMTSGCAAMSIGMYRDSEGKSPYEMFSGAFEAGGIVNVGSCVANAHIAGAAVKIASIFAKRNLRANYEEIADYVYNRVGAVGVAWGAMSQKAAAIAAGFWRLGIPVIVGPQGSKYRRMLLGRADRPGDWYVYDARTGEKVQVGPVPEHLFCAAETREEAMVLTAKLCMRPNDTTRGRALKLTHYMDLHRRHYGMPPADLHLFVRTPADIPITMKDEVQKILADKGWRESTIPDPTLLPRMIRAGTG